jgi:small conductance mechanosensitive channel
MESIQVWLNENGMNLLYQIGSFAFLLLAAGIIIRILSKLLVSYFAKSDRLNEILENLLLSIFSKVLWLIAILIALPQIGVDVTPLIATLTGATVVIGLAFQNSLSNVAAGFMISLNEPFKVGDFIDAGGASGTVRDLNFMSTTMTTGDNKKVVVPNNEIWGSTITNYSALPTRRIDLIVGIGYSSHIGKAIDVMQNVIKTHQQIHVDPKPLIEVNELADSSVNLVIRAWVDRAYYGSTKFSLNRAFKEQLEQAGIELPFPQLDVHHHGIQDLNQQ